MKPEVALSGPKPVCKTQGASKPWTLGELKLRESQSRLELNSSAPNSNAPRVRKRRSPFAINCAPFKDHSSVPSNPNARSAFPKEVLHFANPCLAVGRTWLLNSRSFVSWEVERKHELPSG